MTTLHPRQPGDERAPTEGVVRASQVIPPGSGKCWASSRSLGVRTDLPIAVTGHSAPDGNVLAGLVAGVSEPVCTAPERVEPSFPCNYVPVFVDHHDVTAAPHGRVAIG